MRTHVNQHDPSPSQFFGHQLRRTAKERRHKASQKIKFLNLMEAVENIRNTIKLYIRKARKVKVNYYFGFIILLSWFLFGTSFTTLFGGWIVYNPPVQDKYASK